jgi:hypothetical protein
LKNSTQMAQKIVVADLQSYRGPNSTVYTGRPQGEEARKNLLLQKKDDEPCLVSFKLPADTTTITPSFFLGLLYDSIKKLGFEQYKKKYEFDFTGMTTERISILKKDIEEGERNAVNSSKGQRGISFFLKK